MLLLFTTSVLCKNEEFCDKSRPDIVNWSNSVMKDQDVKRRRDNWKYSSEAVSLMSRSDVRDAYYKLASEVNQSACNVIKRVSGRWMGGCGFLDGEKLLCMDGLYDAVINKTCIVYSFGLCEIIQFVEFPIKYNSIFSN